MVPEFGQSSLRELIHRPFRIVYRCDSGTVRIVRVRHSERGPRPTKNEWIIPPPERRMSGTQGRPCEEGERR